MGRGPLVTATIVDKEEDMRRESLRFASEMDAESGHATFSTALKTKKRFNSFALQKDYTFHSSAITSSLSSEGELPHRDVL